MVIRINLVIGIVAFLLLRAEGQNEITDSLEKILPSLKGKERMKTLGDLTWEWSSLEADKGIVYGLDYLKMAIGSGDSTEVGEACNLLAVAYYRKGNYDEALKMNRRAYRIRKASGDLRSIGSSLNKFVNIYSDQVKLDSALRYGLESVRIFEQLGDSANLSVSLNMISAILQKERDWKTCAVYARRAFRIASAMGFDYGAGGAAGNLGVAYEGLNQLDSSRIWYEEASRRFQAAGSLPDLATVANNLGFLYSKQGDLQRARENYQIALNMAEQLGERGGIAHYSANLGGVFNSLKLFTEARYHFERSLAIAESENLGRVRLQCYEGLAIAFANLGDGSQTSRFFGRYVSLKDSLYNEDRSAQLAEMRTIYETEKKEQENSFLRINNQQKDRENRIIIFVSVIIVSLLVLSGVLVYIGYRRRQEIRLQSAVIAEREAGLKAVFDATEDERKRIAKDLHDGIGQQLSGLKLSWEALSKRIHSTSPEEKSAVDRLSQVLEEAARDVRSISHQMMPRVLSEQGLLPALGDMLQKSLGIIPGIQYRLEHFRVEGARFDERVEIGVYRICQELINNIIKHSGASEVVVQLFTNKGQLVVIVEDNGRGFSGSRESDGIGLLNITSRINTVNGEVTWEPGPSSGTVATIRVPVIPLSLN